jgi:hypothetical protein
LISYKILTFNCLNSMDTVNLRFCLNFVKN